ncbi:uncharacterized protein LOC131927713 [Physella acuta]|uniref:uncharacterized protein LOC131927713 n=1 Tax=Physella acuta TaxID=109671 RepID=UPI0027DE4CCC|nr:uncharacterized protein LOC131927713 [Physella acuta]
MKHHRLILFVFISSYFLLCQSKLPKKKCVNVGYCDFQQPPCGVCGRKINLTITAINNLNAPYFNISVTLVNVYQRRLSSMMEEAANKLSSFRFKLNYYPNLGYSIDSINDLVKTNERYWLLTNNGAGDDFCGIHNYVPDHEEEIILLYSPSSFG